MLLGKDNGVMVCPASIACLASRKTYVGAGPTLHEAGTFFGFGDTEASFPKNLGNEASRKRLLYIYIYLFIFIFLHLY